MNANQWQWRDSVLTCDLLADWQHGFFTRSHAPKSPTELHNHLVASGKAYRAKQVHGNRLIHADEIEVTPNTNVLIGDHKLGAVAAVHAGWRGTATGIVTKAIATLCDQGSELIDLRVALGPAISGSVYQVSQDVAKQVTATINQTVGLQPDEHPERVKLDLRQVQLQQLQELGMLVENVAIAPYCTLQHEEIFFSYRRYFLNNPNPHPRAPQVQWSGIAIT